MYQRKESFYLNEAFSQHVNKNSVVVAILLGVCMEMAPDSSKLCLC